MGMSAALEFQHNRSSASDSDGQLLLMLIMQKQALGDPTGFGGLGPYLGQPGRWAPVTEVLDHCSLGLAEIQKSMDESPPHAETPGHVGGFLETPFDVAAEDIENEMKQVIEHLHQHASDQVRLGISL